MKHFKLKSSYISLRRHICVYNYIVYLSSYLGRGRERERGGERERGEREGVNDNSRIIYFIKCVT